MNVLILFCVLFLFCPQEGAGGKAPGMEEDGARQYGFEGFEIYKVEGGIYALAFSDVDGDGREDFGFVNNSRSRIELFMRLPDDAEDRMALNKITYDGRFKKEFIPVEKQIWGLAFGRFDDGETIDTAMVTEEGELIIEFRGRERETMVLEDFKRLGGCVLSEDMDGDGRDELILFGEKKTLIYRPGGEITTLNNLKKKPSHFGLGDLDGDGLRDLVYQYQGDYPFLVRFQEEPGFFGPAETWELGSVRSFHMADTDGDGKDEIFAVYSNSGRLARFGLEESDDFLFRFYPLRGIEDAEKVSYTCADINGDGADEILFADADAARIVVMGGLCSGTSAWKEEFSSLRDVRNPRVFDMDGDGAMELAVISETEGVIGISAIEVRDDGKAVIAFPTFFPVEGNPAALDVGDVDGDGLDDAVCISTKGEGSRKEYLLSLCREVRREDEKKRAVSTFTIQEAKPKKKILKKTPRDLLLADVDRKGRDDILLFIPGESPAIVFTRHEEPIWQNPVDGEAAGLGLLDNAREWMVCAADSDGDGLLELAAASGNLVRFLFVPGQGEFHQAAGQYNSPEPGARFSGCAYADVVGGDLPELILFESKTNTVRVVGREGDELLKIDTGKLEFCGIETPDLNGDGKSDMLLKGRNQIGVWVPGESRRALKEIGTFESRDKESYFKKIASGDVNSDGGHDVILTDTGQNSLFIISMKGAELEHALKFRVFEEKLFHGKKGAGEPSHVRVHDLTGDGKDDIVILVHDKIIIYPQG